MGSTSRSGTNDHRFVVEEEDGPEVSLPSTESPPQANAHASVSASHLWERWKFTLFNNPGSDEQMPAWIQCHCANLLAHWLVHRFSYSGGPVPDLGLLTSLVPGPGGRDVNAAMRQHPTRGTPGRSGFNWD